MVAVVTGAGTGLERSSAQILGGAGLIGSAGFGTISDSVYLNGATGNLIVQRQDEFLIGLGPDSAIGRTYNSLGTLSGETDNWTWNVQRTVNGLTGTVNTAGSTITRTGWDGAQVVYYFTASLGAYVSKEGAGAQDTLTFNAGTAKWTWTDGSSRITDIYDNANGGRIISTNDTDGNALTYSYNGSGQISRVTTQDGGYTDFNYTGANLTSLTTVSGGVTTNRIAYEYDNENRLIKVTVDKTPTNGGDNTDATKTYVTNYTYITGTKLVNQVWSDTGSYVSILYDYIGGQFRPYEIRNSAAPNAMRRTNITYDLTNRITTVTNQGGSTLQVGDHATQLSYDTAGQLTGVSSGQVASVQSPEYWRVASFTPDGRSQAFTYDGAGNVTSVTDGEGHTTRYGYDNNDNRVWEVDAAGNQINWYYDANNQVIEEVRFRAADPDGAGSGTAGDAAWTRYTYDSENHLRYAISYDGRVTEYEYFANGLLDGVVEYTGALYPWGGTPPTEAEMNTWVSGLADKTKATLSRTTYDFRGNISTVTSYGKITTGGAGDASATTEISKTIYTYSQTGQLLTRQMGDSGPTESFVYDGLGRMIAATDFLGDQTSIAFTDSNWISTVVTTRADGSMTTSSYSSAGELLGASVAGTGVTTASSSYRYDRFGRLRSIIDPSYTKSHMLYDLAGRKVADIAADGGLVEYIYNDDDQVIATVAYATKLSSTTLGGFLDANDNPLDVALSSVRPSASSDDRWTWNVYDAADRLVETIDGAGTATVFTYDGASQLVATKVYANALTVSGFKTTPPTTLQTPTAHANDRTTRSFYDGDGNLAGVLDAAGYLTEYVYDAAGRKVETIAYATLTNSGYWATGTLSNLRPAAATGDVRTRYVYDGRSLLRGTIDAEGAVTTFSYDTAGRVIKSTEHATLYSTSGAPTFADLQTWASSNASVNDRITRTVYDNAGQPRYIVDAEGFVTEKQYLYGRVTKDIRYAVAVSASDGMTPAGMAALLPSTIPSTAAVTTYAYDGVGRLKDVTDAEGGVTHSVYNVLGQVTDVTTAYGTAYAATTHYTYDVVGRVLTTTVPLDGSTSAVTTSQYDAFGNLVKLTDPRGNSAYYYYDKLGRQTLQIDPEGYATVTAYDGFGQTTSVTRYDNATSGAAVGSAPTPSGAAATTTFLYDNLGRVTRVTDAEGAYENYTLDAFGNRTAVRNKLGGITNNTYDRRGLLIQENLPVGSIINKFEYDAWGNRTKTIEAYGQTYARTTNFVYDKLGRITAEFGAPVTVLNDALGEYTATSTSLLAYDARGNITASYVNGALTFHYYDRLDRKTAQVDPAGTLSTWTYDPNGNVMSARVYGDDLGGGSSGPMTSVAQAVLAGQAVTDASYRDLLGQFTDPNSAILNLFTGDSSDTAKVYRLYDVALGRLPTDSEVANWLWRLANLHGGSLEGICADILTDGGVQAHLDATGDNTRFIKGLYQAAFHRPPTAGEVSYWLGAGWSRSAMLALFTEEPDHKAISTAAFIEALASRVAPSPVNSSNYRETTYTYDKNNRRLSTSVAGVKSAHYASGYTITTGTITTYTNYDANGNLVQEIDGEGNSAYHYYDKLGRKKATVDREGFVTTYELDADGNVLTERRYATQTSGLTATAFGTPGTTTDDRVTIFTYDQNGRRLTETRTGVVAWNVNATTGALTAASTSATITYTYNGLGQVLTKTEAATNALTSTRDSTSYVYDVGGRLSSITEAAITDFENNSRARVTAYSYDALNNVTRERVGLAAESGSDHNTYYTYGAQGRLATMTDANGFVRTYAYDRQGNVRRESYVRTKSDGSTVEEANVFKYDVLNRQTFQAKATKSGSTWVIGDSQEIQYNVYGEISAKGTNGLWQETFLYDKGGRLVRTTAGDGVTRFFFHDKNGNVTLTVASAGADLGAYATQDALIPALGTIPNPVTGMLLTISAYNRRDDNTFNVETHRYLPAANPWSPTMRTFTAFGEVASESSYRGSTLITTEYKYNTLGKMVEKKNPTVSVTAENGVVDTTKRPTETYYYDLSGRLVGAADANGNVTTRQLLAGTGYGGAEALVTAEYHLSAGTTVKRTGYDVFGDARKIFDEAGVASTGVKFTQQAFDKMGRLTTLTRPSLHQETYAYDELGQRIRHGNSMAAFAGYTEKTDYDAQGRVIKFVDYQGGEVSYTYAWNGSLSTSGLATFGGWTKTTYQYGSAATESTDVFGRVIGRVDFGGGSAGTFSYTYNTAGWMTAQTSGAGVGLFGARNIAYTYYNTGAVATVTDTGGQGSGSVSVMTYSYDEAGNILTERQDVTIGGVTKTLENSVSTYDALNRRLKITDFHPSTPGTGRVIEYEYDAAGNQRRELSTRVAPAMTTVVLNDSWYKYDNQNRMVLVNGTMNSGTISGQEIQYDEAGRRAAIVTHGPGSEYVVNYAQAYTVPGYTIPERTDTGGFYLKTDELVESTRTHDYSTGDETIEDVHGNLGYTYPPGPGTTDLTDSTFWCPDGYRHYAEVVVDPVTYPAGTYTGNVQYEAVYREVYTYNDDGYLTSVATQNTRLNGTWTTAELYSTDTRDALGRVTTHEEYMNPGYALPSGTIALKREVDYNRRGDVTQDTVTQWNGHLSFDVKQYKSVTTYTYTTSGGAYLGGQAVSSSSTNSHRDLSGGSWGSWTSDPGSSSANTYILRDSPLLSTNTLTTSTTASEYFLRRYHKDLSATSYTSTYNYDANNNLSYVAVADGKPRMMTYLSTSEGQRVWTKETLGTTAVTGLKSAFDASVFGTGVFNGVAWYGKSETARDAFDARNALQDSSIRTRTLYDGGYQAVTPDGVPSTAGAYVVQAGDTLQSIAAQTWGDSSLWYMIAEANGLSGSGQIAAGQRLTIPNKIANFHNTGDTFRPYNASDNMGAVAPNRAAPPKPKKAKCGGLGAVLMIFVAAVVAIYVGPQIAAHFLEGAASGSTAFATAATAEAAASLTTLGGVVTGAATGALSSFASQMFGVAADIQDKIDWKAVGMSALGGAISGGLGASKVLGEATKFGKTAWGGAVRGVVGNMASQAIGVRLGLQDRFDWTGVAAAGLGALTGSWASDGIEGMKGEAFYALGSAVGDAGARSLIDGTSFGDNLRAALPSVIAQTIGNMVAGSLAAQSQPEPQSEPTADLYDDINADWLLSGEQNPFAYAGTTDTTDNVQIAAIGDGWGSYLKSRKVSKLLENALKELTEIPGTRGGERIDFHQLSEKTVAGLREYIGPDILDALSDGSGGYYPPPGVYGFPGVIFIDDVDRMFTAAGDGQWGVEDAKNYSQYIENARNWMEASKDLSSLVRLPLTSTAKVTKLMGTAKRAGAVASKLDKAFSKLTNVEIFSREIAISLLLAHYTAADFDATHEKVPY